MSEIAVLEILLHNEPIATLTQLPGDRNLLSFNEAYVDNPNRSILSLSFKDEIGELVTETMLTRTRVHPFFSNLLPEGHMRQYLAAQAQINPQREFYLLDALGRDLPGALTVRKIKNSHLEKNENLEKVLQLEKEKTVLRFSLAGIQLKFSAVWEKEKGLTIPVNGVGGSWILKLPSSVYAGVPENEYAMMELARQVGIDVPETALIPIDQIHGLPKEIERVMSHAYIIKRFDRTPEGEGVHIEDFAQIFGVFPEKKYQSASYRNIAEVILIEVGEKGIVEFIRRLVFNALIGNGDMHLKNWSLMYPDKKKAALAPAYDFVSTIPYLPEDELALSFVDSKAFSSLTYNQFKRFAEKSKLREDLVVETARDTVKSFTKLWQSIGDFPLDSRVVKIISEHLKNIPLFTD